MGRSIRPLWTSDRVLILFPDTGDWLFSVLAYSRTGWVHSVSHTRWWHLPSLIHHCRRVCGGLRVARKFGGSFRAHRCGRRSWWFSEPSARWLYRRCLRRGWMGFRYDGGGRLSGCRSLNVAAPAPNHGNRSGTRLSRYWGTLERDLSRVHLCSALFTSRLEGNNSPCVLESTRQLQRTNISENPN